MSATASSLLSRGVCGERWRVTCLGALIPGATLLFPSLTAAQTSLTEYSIQGMVTATNNGAGAPSGQERKDVFTSVRPRVQVLRQGAGLRLAGSLEADFLASARGTRSDKVLPTAHVDAAATLIDRVLFLDAGADIRQVEVDTFGARVGEGSPENARTAGTFRISPFINYELTSATSLLARYTDVRTRYSGPGTDDVSTGSGIVRLEVKPRPIGGGLEWSDERTEYRQVDGSGVRIGRLAATVSVAVGDWVLGAVAGRERSELSGTADTESLAGARLYWAPGPRTELAAAVDRRFFGTGWSSILRHRTARMSFLLRAEREPVTASSGVRGAGLSSFLDSILTTRNPDADQRRGLVDGLIATRGLREDLGGPIGSSAAYAQLKTGAEATTVYLGPRTTLSFTVFVDQRRRLVRDDDLAVTSTPTLDDRRQRGVSLGWNHRLTPQMSLDVSLGGSNTEGLADRLGDRSRERSLRSGMVQGVSPRTSLTYGLSLRKIDTNVSGVNSFDETAGYFGLLHRF
jgi:uncharacterized protein (PEP-CTERM system associated)